MIKLRRYLAYYKKECIIGPLCKLFEAIFGVARSACYGRNHRQRCAKRRHGIHLENGRSARYSCNCRTLQCARVSVSCIKGISGCGNKTSPRFVFAHQQTLSRRVGQARHSVTYNTNHIRHQSGSAICCNGYPPAHQSTVYCYRFNGYGNDNQP